VSEPELGLGEVQPSARERSRSVSRHRRNREIRAPTSRPDRRAAFRIGDTIASRTRGEGVVDAVDERAGLLYYSVSGRELQERN
jgi:hypothetical protein